MSFEPLKFEGGHKTVSTELKQNSRSKLFHSFGGNVISLGDALRKVIASGEQKQGTAAAKKQVGKPR
jgi:hypothetical protein